MIKVSLAGKSDPGLQRSRNEDAFAIREDLGLCVLADGMGGAAAGEVASDIFIQTAVELFVLSTDLESNVPQLIQSAFQSAQTRILDHVKANPNHQGMGCTAELLAFYGNGYALGHVGDSRTYIWRRGQLKQLTRDHSLVQEELEKGTITPDQAKRHPMRNIILRAVGMKEALALDLVRGAVVPGDIFLLCSDGLSDMVDDEFIREVLGWEACLEEKVDKLIEGAKRAGGYDNITAVLAQVLPE